MDVWEGRGKEKGGPGLDIRGLHNELAFVHRGVDGAEHHVHHPWLSTPSKTVGHAQNENSLNKG